MKIGIQLATLRMPLKRGLQWCAELGVQGIELDARSEVPEREMTDTAVRHLRKLFSDHNLSVAAVRFQTRRGYEVLDELDARIDATKRALRLAYRLGASVVLNDIGRATPADAEAWETMLASLSDIGRESQRVGAWLAATTGPLEVESLAKLFAELPAGSLAVNLDPGELIIHGGSPREAVRTLGEHVRHIQAHDGVRDLARGRGIETPLGQGSADFPELAAVLEEQRYRGFFTVARHQSSNRLAEVEQAVSYLRSLQS